MIWWVEEILHQLIGALSMFIPLFIGFQPSKVMQDFFHPMIAAHHCYRAPPNARILRRTAEL
jgi:hypothetical protein